MKAKNANLTTKNRYFSSLLSLRIGLGSSSSQSQTTLHETSARGSSLRSEGDITLIARDGDLSITGSRVEGDNIGLAAKRDILLRSAVETSEQRERSKSSSGEIGLTIGSEAGIGIYVSASASRGKGDGTSKRHAETVIQGKGTVRFVSGNDTTLEGAQIIGERVIGQVGGDLTIRSQQDTENYRRRDQSAGIDAAFGTGGGSVNVSYSQSKINSNYTSVREQSGIQAGAGGFQIDVKGHTQLDGGAIASTADAARNLLITGSLGYTDLQNKAEYKAQSISVSGGTSGGGTNPWTSSARPGLSVPQKDSSTSTTRAGITAGTLIVGDGSGLDIARDITELQQDGLKTLFNEQKVRERMELSQLAGEVGYRAAGDLAGRMGWQEGSKEKALLHGLVGAGMAALGGGNALEGLSGAVASQLASTALQQYLLDQKIDPDSPQGKTLMELGSLAIGMAVGGGSGASTALAGEQFNRQLHPDEIKFLKNENVIADYIAYMEAQGVVLTQEQARASLDRYAAAGEDAQWSALNGRDPLTEAFLESASKGKYYTDSRGNQRGFFKSTEREYQDETLNLKALFAGYAPGNAVAEFLNNNFNAKGQDNWNVRFREGQQKGAGHADQEAGWISDIGTLLSGLKGIPGYLVDATQDSQKGPFDDTQMADYYQKLLHIQGRAEEAGFVYEYDWATTQRLIVTGIPLAEVGGLIAGKLAKAAISRADGVFTKAKGDANTSGAPLVSAIADSEAGTSAANMAPGVGGSAGAMRRLDYEAAPYHGKFDNAVKSRAPVNGQDALDVSIQVKPTSPRRVGIDYSSNEFVVFDKTLGVTYHGHVRLWKDLHPDMQRALREAGMVDRNGNILTGGR